MKPTDRQKTEAEIVYAAFRCLNDGKMVEDGFNVWWPLAFNDSLNML